MQTLPWVQSLKILLDLNRILLNNNNVDTIYASSTSISNTPELIAHHLRQAILRGQLKSQQPLRQDKLAQELGVSKIPLR